MREKIIALLKKALGAAAAGVPIELSVPEEPAFGHFSTNVAMRIAKARGRKPIELAEELAREIERAAPAGFFEKVEAAMPGFVNFWMSKKAVQESFAALAKDKDFGKNNDLAGKTIMVEFTDPNPFKLFHIGHLMSNTIGESFARLHEASGAKVERLSYGGDVGLHVAKAIFGVLARKEEIAKVRAGAEKMQLVFWADAYVSGSARYEDDEAAKRAIDELNKTIFERSNKEINELYLWGRDISIRAFKEMFVRLGTTFSKNYWESEVMEDGVKMVEEGLSKKILEKSDGAVVFKGEPYGLHTRVFMNSRGVPTYEAKELGLTLRKHRDFDFDQSIVITGNEQNDYFKVLLKVVDLLMPELAGKTIHLSHGMLRFASGKMSSRKGNVITAESLLEQIKTKLRARISEKSDLDEKERETVAEVIAIGAIKYSILKQNPGQDIVFDFEKSLSFEGDAGPYVQYTYARLRSIVRKAPVHDRTLEEKGANKLDSEIELALMRRMAEFPDVVARARELYAPSGLVVYVYKLASLANKFYETTPILKDEDDARRDARLVLVGVAAEILKSGLDLLGIKTLEKI